MINMVGGNLADLLIPVNSGRLLAVLYGFFDDTQSHGEYRISGLAGFLFDRPGLDAFHAEWGKRASALHPKFRTSSFRAKDGPAYKAASDYDREHLLPDLAHITAKHRGPGFVCSIDSAVFESWASGPHGNVEYVGNAYAACLVTILGMIRGYLREQGSDEDVSIVMEAGTTGEELAIKFGNRIMAHEAQRRKYGLVHFGTALKSTETALHAADYLACEWQANYKEAMRSEAAGNGSGVWRKEFVALLEPSPDVPILWKHLDSVREFRTLSLHNILSRTYRDSSSEARSG